LYKTKTIRRKKMRGIRRLFIGVVTTLVIVGFSLSAYSAEEDVKEIKQQIRVLTEEMEKLKLGAVAEPKYESFMGLGPAASKVYTIDKGLSLGGYGEVVYSNYQQSSKKDFSDAFRLVLYTGYKFNDWILMNSELEFEHAGVKNVGAGTGSASGAGTAPVPQVFVEFAYLDFLLSKPLNVRAGLLLVPIGRINELHEPTVFYGVFRPEVEQNIIPSTWRELGAMAYGEPVNGLTYKVALINGLRADRFSDSQWIRNSRQQGAEANADIGAVIANVNYDITQSLSAGGSYYRGSAATGKGNDGEFAPSVDRKGRVTMYEAHADFRYSGLELRGLYVAGVLDKANDNLKAQGIGREVEGWYLQAAYNVLPLIKPGTEMGLSPFVRHEEYNTHKEVFGGQPNKGLDRTVTTVGFSFKPHSQVVIKADYQSKDTASLLTAGKGTNRDENKIDQYNIGIGFIF
jgi:hypothetical protein